MAILTFCANFFCRRSNEQDPNQFSLHPDRNLAENGLLDEVLDGLPYKSTIGTMTRKDWEDMSTGQRDAFIWRIKKPYCTVRSL